METAITELIGAIRSKQCVAFIGAGLSKSAGLPLWGELIEDMKATILNLAESKKDKDEEERYINNAGYLDIATRFKYKVGLGHYHKFLQERYRKSILKTPDEYVALSRINSWPFIITTNYDKILEVAFTQPRDIPPAIVTEPEELIMSFRSGKFFILKLHGDIDRPKSIVLTRDEYEQFIFDRRGQMLLDSLKQQLIYRTVLFLGFSLTDPNFLRVLGEAGWLAMGYQGEAYSIMADTSKPEREEWQRRRLRIIPISNHNELPNFLHNLANKVIGIGNDVIVLNKLGYNFEAPKEFLNSNPFVQISDKIHYDLVSNQLSSSHTGFSINFIESDEIRKHDNLSFKEVANTNHLLITLRSDEIKLIPKNFWEKLPCNYKTLNQYLVNEKKVLIGVTEKDGFYNFLVAAYNSEQLNKAISDLFNLTSIPT